MADAALHGFERSRPYVPQGYGIPDSNNGMLPWSFVSEHLAAAHNYWICTVRPDGRPHAMPVWGAWLEETLYFEGSPDTRRGRNLEHNPAVAIHLESADQVVIVEGFAAQWLNPDRELTTKLSAHMTAKYGAKGYAPGPDSWDNGGLYRVQIITVFAWSKFPEDVTRWRRTNFVQP